MEHQNQKPDPLACFHLPTGSGLLAAYCYWLAGWHLRCRCAAQASSTSRHGGGTSYPGGSRGVGREAQRAGRAGQAAQGCRRRRQAGTAQHDDARLPEGGRAAVVARHVRRGGLRAAARAGEPQPGRAARHAAGGDDREGGAAREARGQCGQLRAHLHTHRKFTAHTSQEVRTSSTLHACTLRARGMYLPRRSRRS